MATKTRIQLRRDTAANWTANDPTLAQGELGFETDTGYWKFGDGSTAWTSLGYPTPKFASASISGTLSVDTINEFTGANGVTIDTLNIKDGNITMLDGGTIGQSAGPLITFDDTNNYLGITGCDVGIGTDSPSSLLQLMKAGASVSLSLVRNNSGTTNQLGSISFGNTTDDNLVSIISTEDGANDSANLTFWTEATGAGKLERMRIDSAGNVFIGDSANTFMTQGLTINQGAADNEILALKSSDVTHGMTDIAEADTYGFMRKASAGDGSLAIISLCEGSSGMSLRGYVTTETTTDTSSSGASVMILGGLKSGTGIGTLGATGNVFAVANYTDTRFIIKGNGDGHITNTTWTALDHEDDIALTEAAKQMMTPDKVGLSKEMWNRLVEARVFNKAGDMINFQRMMALNLGTDGQIVNMVRGLAEFLNIPDADEKLKLWAKQYQQAA